MSAEERLEALRKAPPNAWLALSDDESRVVGVAQTYEEAVELAAKSGVDDPVLIKRPAEWLIPVYS